MTKRKINNGFGATLLTGFFAAFAVLGGCTEKQKPQAVDKILIGVQPNDATLDLEQLRSDLSKRIGLPVEFVKTKDYSDSVEKFKNGEIQFSFFTALTFIQAEREADAKALLKKLYDGNEFYYSAIVVRKDSKFKAVADLKGHRFGFVDKKSTSGYLYPRVLLRQAGLDAGVDVKTDSHVSALESEFFGTHENSVRALAAGKVDAIGVWVDEPQKNVSTGAWTGVTGIKKDFFKILATSEPIPSDAFAVREKFYQDNPMIVFKVMEALIGVSEDPSKILKKVLDVDGMVTATSRHYDGVRAVEALMKGDLK